MKILTFVTQTAFSKFHTFRFKTLLFFFLEQVRSICKVVFVDGLHLGDSSGSTGAADSELVCYVVWCGPGDGL